MVIAAGCGGPKPVPPPPKETEPPKPISVVSERGDATWYGNEAARPPIWHVEWQKANLSSVGDTPTVGKMSTVKGEIFQKKETKTFSADQAVAQASNVLTLTGNVLVFSPNLKATLKCDKLVYDANKKLFDAQGNVSLKGKNINIEGVPEAVATSDFDQVASDEGMLKEKNAKQ